MPSRARMSAACCATQGHAGIAAERDVAAGARDGGLADGDAEIAGIGSLAARAVEQYVFHEHDRVVEFAAGSEQADDVARGLKA